MNDSRNDQRFAKAAAILKRRDRAFVALFVGVIGVIVVRIWDLPGLDYLVALAFFLSMYYLLSAIFSRCPFCGNRWGFYANLRDACNPFFVFKRPGFLMSRCINCGANDQPAKW